MRSFLAKALATRKARIVVIAAILAVAVFAGMVVTPYAPNGEDGEYLNESSSTESLDMRAKVIAVNQRGELRVEILDGLRKGSVRTIEDSVERYDVTAGDTIVINETAHTGLTAIGPWRLPGIILLAALLVVAVIAVSGLKGLYSLAGLVFGVGIIFLYTIPSILSGGSAFAACVVTAFAIGTVSVYISHGFNRRALISILAIAAILCVTTALALLGSFIAQLSGVVDEASGYIALYRSHIDLSGVLVGGIIIATLGVLDDVVTTQVATADEILKTDSRLSRMNLFRRTMSVGNEHIAALINTLVLAYVGVSLPTLLLFLSEPSMLSVAATVNTEFLAHEVVRALVSSIALVLAVPISTGVAVVLLKSRLGVLQKHRQISAPRK